jgi:hypothetical protein
MKYLVEVEPAIPANGDKPSLGPAYRNVAAKDGLKDVPKNISSCWDLFRWVPCVFFLFSLVLGKFQVLVPDEIKSEVSLKHVNFFYSLGKLWDLYFEVNNSIMFLVISFSPVLSFLAYTFKKLLRCNTEKNYET